MSEITDFAGLTALEVGEPQDERFLSTNIFIIDRLLKLGAVLHRHDAHAAIVDPPQDDGTGPVVAVDPTGGTIPADMGIYVGYTYLDADGGESILSDATLASTPPPLDPPIDAPDAAVDTTAGGLLTDTYSYAATVTDGLGGETMLGPSIEVTVDPGYANAQIQLSGLATLLADAGGTEWRVYRARGGGGFVFLAQGAGTP
jgi:hypothetical protein